MLAVMAATLVAETQSPVSLGFLGNLFSPRNKCTLDREDEDTLRWRLPTVQMLRKNRKDVLPFDRVEFAKDAPPLSRNEFETDAYLFMPEQYTVEHHTDLYILDKHGDKFSHHATFFSIVGLPKKTVFVLCPEGRDIAEGKVYVREQYMDLYFSGMDLFYLHEAFVVSKEGILPKRDLQLEEEWKTRWKKLADKSGSQLPDGLLDGNRHCVEVEVRRPDESLLTPAGGFATSDQKTERPRQIRTPEPAAFRPAADTPAELSAYLRQKGQPTLADLADTILRHPESASRYQMWTDHYLPTAVRCIRNLESKMADSELKEESVQTLRDLDRAADRVCADIQRMEDMEERAELGAVRQMLRLNGDLPDGSGFGEKQ